MRIIKTYAEEELEELVERDGMVLTEAASAALDRLLEIVEEGFAEGKNDAEIDALCLAYIEELRSKKGTIH